MIVRIGSVRKQESRVITLYFQTIRILVMQYQATLSPVCDLDGKINFFNRVLLELILCRALVGLST